MSIEVKDSVTVVGGGIADDKSQAGDSSEDSDAPSETSPGVWKKSIMSCRGYRSHLTRRVNSTKKLIDFGNIHPSSTVCAQLLDAKSELDIAYNKVCSGFQKLFDLNPPEKDYQDQQAKLDRHTEEYDDICTAILEAVQKMKRPPSTQITRNLRADSDQQIDQGADRPKMKVNSALKPEKLTETFTPREFYEWGVQFQAYYRTSHFDQCTLPDQHAYLRQCINKTLWFRISSANNANTEMFGDVDSCLSLLLGEFQERYPQFNRRLAFFRAEQLPGQSMTDFMIKNRQLHNEADMHEITQDELLLFKNISGCKDRSCLLYTSPSPRDKRQSRMPSSA